MLAKAHADAGKLPVTPREALPETLDSASLPWTVAPALADDWLDQTVQDVCQLYGARRPQWTAAEEQFLRSHLGRMSYADIAAALGRTVDGLHAYMVRKRIPWASRQPDCLTAKQTGRALGMDTHSVMMMSRRGVLPIERMPGARTIMRITRLRLYMWAVDPEHWIYFPVDKMGDAHLQRLVRMAQARWADEWLSFGQAEKLIGMGDGVLVSRLHRGDPLLRNEVKRWGNWFIRRSVAESLIFKPSPVNPDGRNFFTSRGDAYLLQAETAGLRYAEIARRMDWPEDRVGKRLRRLHVLRPTNWVSQYARRQKEG